jgi:hypothetical protein
LTANATDRLAAHEAYLETLQFWDHFTREARAHERVRSFEGNTIDAIVTAARCEAEIGLMQERARGHPSDSEAKKIQQLLRTRRGALRQARRNYEAAVSHMPSLPHYSTLKTRLEISRRLLQAELELTDSMAKRVAALQAYFADVQGYEELCRRTLVIGRLPPAHYASIKVMCLDAEIDLRQQRAKGSINGP